MVTDEKGFPAVSLSYRVLLHPKNAYLVRLVTCIKGSIGTGQQMMRRWEMFELVQEFAGKVRFCPCGQHSHLMKIKNTIASQILSNFPYRTRMP